MRIITKEETLGDRGEYLDDWAVTRKDEYNHSLISQSVNMVGVVISRR